MSAIEIALHGPDAACHDQHTQAGDFARAIEAMRAAHAANEPVIATTILTRSNYRVLAAMPALLHGHGVGAWHLAIAPFAESTEGPARSPRLAMALSFALHALARAEQLGTAIAIAGAPRCLLGSFARVAITTAPRSFPAPCDRCTARPTCAGVDAAYVARFGASELTPAR